MRKGFYLFQIHISAQGQERVALGTKLKAAEKSNQTKLERVEDQIFFKKNSATIATCDYMPNKVKEIIKKGEKYCEVKQL